MTYNPYTPPNSTPSPIDYLPIELDIRMKLIALAPQFYLYDVHGNQAGYIRQKLFKFKEAIQVFNNDSKSVITHAINADRMLDFGASYQITSSSRGLIGHTKRDAISSLWRTKFEVFDTTQTLRYTISLKNPLVQFIEGILSIIPIVGEVLNLISGYLLNPTYLIYDTDGEVVAEMKKLPAFFEGKYQIRKMVELSDADGELIALSLLTLLLIQRESDG